MIAADRTMIHHCHINDRFSDKDFSMGELLGYMRVSKADGSQTLDLQRDALLSAGVSPNLIDHDLVSGKKDDRVGLESCLKAIRPGDELPPISTGQSA